jgi:hypothetical protein
MLDLLLLSGFLLTLIAFRLLRANRMMISCCHRFDGFDVSNHNCVLKALSVVVDYLGARSSSALKSRLLLILRALKMDIIYLPFLMRRRCVCFKSGLCRLNGSRVFSLDLHLLWGIRLQFRRCVCFQSGLCRLNGSRVFRLDLHLLWGIRLQFRRCVCFKSGLCRLNGSQVFSLDLHLLWVFNFRNKLIFIGWHCNYVVCRTSVIQLHLKIFFLLIFHNLDFRSFLFLVFLKHLLQLSGLFFQRLGVKFFDEFLLGYSILLKVLQKHV